MRDEKRSRAGPEIPLCVQRGFCGPFRNEERYNRFEDPRWHGMGECVHCRSTVRVERHEGRRAATGRSEEGGPRG